MCEINFIHGLGKPLGSNEVGKLADMLTESARTNTDGFGIFNDKGLIFKSPDAFDASKHMEGIYAVANGSDFVVAHNRAATQGSVAYQNTHPFKVNSFLFCHNGILYNDDKLRKRFKIKDKVKTDSVTIGHIIHHYSTQHKPPRAISPTQSNETANSALPKAISQTTKHLSGFHSVFIYDLTTKTLYYFKHNANFTFRLVNTNGKYCILGSTDGDNSKRMTQGTIYGFPISAEQVSKIDPTDDTLYQINETGLHEIQKLEFPSYESLTSYANQFTDANGNKWHEQEDPHAHTDQTPYTDDDYYYSNGVHWVKTSKHKSSKHQNDQNDQNNQNDQKLSDKSLSEKMTTKAIDIITQFYPSLLYQTAGKMIRVENASDFVRQFQHRFKKIKYTKDNPENLIGYIRPKHIRKIANALTITSNTSTNAKHSRFVPKLVHKYN